MGNQPSQPKITAQDKAIFQLKQQRDKLKQYQRRLNVIVQRQNDLAKEAINKNDLVKAKFYLRSKKQQESTIIKTYDQLDNLESLIGTIEFKLIEKDVLYGLQQGNQVLAKLNSEMSVDKIDKVLDDIEDERLKVDEVSNMLGMGSALSNSEEDEVDEELNRLNEEINGASKVKDNTIDHKDASVEQRDGKESTISLPDVPNNEIPDSKQTTNDKQKLDQISNDVHLSKQESRGQQHEPLAA